MRAWLYIPSNPLCSIFLPMSSTSLCFLCLHSLLYLTLKVLFYSSLFYHYHSFQSIDSHRNIYFILVLATIYYLNLQTSIFKQVWACVKVVNPALPMYSYAVLLSSSDSSCPRLNSSLGNPLTFKSHRLLLWFLAVQSPQKIRVPFYLCLVIFKYQQTWMCSKQSISLKNHIFNLQIIIYIYHLLLCLMAIN